MAGKWHSPGRIINKDVRYVFLKDALMVIHCRVESVMPQGSMFNIILYLQNQNPIKCLCES